MRRQLPSLFCWTRFGTEAAEPIESILFRKEQERRSNAGLFLWGIGNAVGPSIADLIQRVVSPEVLFSPIKSAPKCKDISPGAVATWTSAVALDGSRFQLPEHSLVTSRYDVSAPRRCHYALVCYQETPFTPLAAPDRLFFNGLRNLKTGRPLGASQVTAVVERVNLAGSSYAAAYDIAMRAELVYPYFVRLEDPIWQHSLSNPAC